MLIRRRIDPTTHTGRRREWIRYLADTDAVRMDPWESDACAARIAAAFELPIIAQPLLTGAWCPLGSTRVTPHPDELVRVLVDPETGYVYYRRRVDLQRADHHNENRAFLVTAEEW